MALGGSGSRTSFYIGFLEVFDERKIKIDFITASSGASIVASAYACGFLNEIKDWAKHVDNDSIKQYVSPAKNGGLYSLDNFEQKMLEFTKGKTFEEVSPKMSFSTVDIETGEEINLCMGDIAKACRISCTLPGVFEPVKWGNKTLVDGGLLNLVPISALKQFPVDVTVGVNIPGTKFIFTGGQITLRKIFKTIKKMLFIDEMENILSKVFEQDKNDTDYEKKPGLFSILAKSMDLSIFANNHEDENDMACDLMIDPKIPKIKPSFIFPFEPFYEMGRKCAEDNLPQIIQIIKQKQEKSNA